MKSDDFSPDAFDPLDEDAIPLDSGEDSEISALLARHLETYQPIPVPAKFRASVHSRVQRLQRWRDFKLVLATGSATALVLTIIITCALGLNWWRRLLPSIRLQDGLAALRSLPRQLPPYLHIAQLLEASLKPLLPFLPLALLLFATGALALEFAIFRYLHLGPFANSRRNAP